MVICTEWTLFTGQDDDDAARHVVLAEFLLFNLRKREYMTMPKPALQRGFCAYAMANGSVYVLGGIADSAGEDDLPLSTVETFTLSTGRWTERYL